VKRQDSTPSSSSSSSSSSSTVVGDTGCTATPIIRTTKATHIPFRTASYPTSTPEVPQKLDLSAVTKAQLAAHADAAAAAADGSSAVPPHQNLPGIPISRIASWISGLPSVSDARSEARGPSSAAAAAATAAACQEGHTWHSYEEAACAPSLARGSQVAQLGGERARRKNGAAAAQAGLFWVAVTW